MKISIGIDLGTTNSVVSYIKNGKIEYIKFRNKKSILSVFLLQKGKVIIGEKARKKSVLYPQHYIKSSKTYMGTDKLWEIDGKKITPTNVATAILNEIKIAVKKEVSGVDEIEAVITVPAYFTSSQIDETKKAAEEADYKVKRIITEPVSAALAYGFEDGINQTIFIVDVGGGTFDTAVLEVKNKVFNTLAVGGDNKLGGDDFDAVILEIFLKYIRKNEGVNLSNLTKSGLADDIYNKAYHMLTSKAEETKIDLSEQEVIEISIANLFDHYNFEMIITREKFEAEAYYLLEKIKREIEKTIEESNLDRSEIDKIVLVGGSARIPAIRNHIIAIFGTTPYADKPLDKLVSIGAAIAATEENTIQIVDIISHSLGVELIGDRFSPIISKNTRYPVSKSKQYTTSYDYQKAVDVKIHEGEDEDNVKNNAYYGGFTLNNIEQARQGVPQIEVTFDFDINRILHVTAKDTNTKSVSKQTVEINKDNKQ